MAFKKGEGGRPKGAKNKSTTAKKEELEALFNENGGFVTLFKSIKEIEEPKDKANALLKVMEFFMSKQKQLELTGENPLESINLVFKPSKITLPTNESQIDGK